MKSGGYLMSIVDAEEGCYGTQSRVLIDIIIIVDLIRLLLLSKNEEQRGCDGYLVNI